MNGQARTYILLSACLCVGACVRSDDMDSLDSAVEGELSFGPPITSISMISCTAAQTGPGQSRPGHARQDQASPGQGRPGQAMPDQ